MSLGGLGVPALAGYADADYVSLYVNTPLRAALVHPRVTGIFSFEEGSLLERRTRRGRARST